MAELPRPDFHSFKIVSVARDQPAGVNYTKPAWQYVRLGEPVQHWVFDKVGPETYKLKINGYHFVGERGGKVIASTHAHDQREWKVIYHPRYDAYTIERPDSSNPGSWTVPDPLSEVHEIEVKVLPVPLPLPPVVPLSQLFKLVSDD